MLRAKYSPAACLKHHFDTLICHMFERRCDCTMHFSAYNLHNHNVIESQTQVYNDVDSDLLSSINTEENKYGSTLT